MPTWTKRWLIKKSWLEKKSNRKNIDNGQERKKKKTLNLYIRELKYLIFFKTDIVFFIIWHYVPFGIYYIFDIISSRRFLPFDIMSHWAFITFGIISSQGFLLLNISSCLRFITVVRKSFRNYLPFDVFYYSMFFMWTFCHIRCFVRRRFLPSHFLLRHIVGGSYRPLSQE